MKTVLALSPHLDDAAFSCGATMARLADAGWRVCMATAFTRSIHPAQGFALACQLDKGLPAETDYMALRRQEDRNAAAHLGVTDLRWLDLPEAPHRGYDSAAALFGPIHGHDTIANDLALLLKNLVADLHPDLVLAPQGLGNHVDHRQMIRAIMDAIPDAPLAFYRDTPYALRNPDALPYVTRDGLEPFAIDIAHGLERKVAAAAAYVSQVGFQFGGTDAAMAALRAFSLDEGEGEPAERFLSKVPMLPILPLLHK